MITEDYVSLETAKMLKEKGFNIPIKRGISSNKINIFYDKPEDINYGLSRYYSQPTLQMAMKWLRELHNLSVEVYRTACGYVGCVVAIPSGTDIEFLNKNGDDLPSGQYTTYEKACEASIKYCLTKLI